MSVDGFRDRLDVRDAQQGIGWSLQPDHSCGRFQGLGYRLGIGRVHKVKIQAEASQDFIK